MEAFHFPLYISRSTIDNRSGTVVFLKSVVALEALLIRRADMERNIDSISQRELRARAALNSAAGTMAANIARRLDGGAKVERGGFTVTTDASEMDEPETLAGFMVGRLDIKRTSRARER